MENTDWIEYAIKNIGPLTGNNPKTAIPILLLLTLIVFLKTRGK